jgi:intracellular septation protein
VLFTVMAIAIAIAQFRYKKNPISIIFNNQIPAPDHVWQKLSVAWIIFLLFIAILNLVFAYFTSTDTWFLFKTFGDMGLFFVFIIAQILWLMPYLPKDDEPAAAVIAPVENAANPSKDAVFQEGKS